MAKLLFRQTQNGFEAGIDDIPLLSHSSARPFICAGSGEGDFSMYRGNFKVIDKRGEMLELRDCRVIEQNDENTLVRLSYDGRYYIDAQFMIGDDRLIIVFSASPNEFFNRFCFRLPAGLDEHIYGCGEQFSYLDLRGRTFPLWTSEQGVGRNKNTEITRIADRDGGSGGDYYWTFYPQPSFVSSRNYWCFLDTTAYAEFDFRQPAQHELWAWALPRRMIFGMGKASDNLSGWSSSDNRMPKNDLLCHVVSDLSDFFGRQGALPDWCYDGVILGIQGGTDICMAKLDEARKHGIKVAGIWAQDWQGINITSFGQRLRWNWVADDDRYPGLKEAIGKLKREGIRFLGYINPYLGADMSLYREAAASGYLAKDRNGDDYLVDFGEFNAGIVDFTNSAAFEWYKNVIKTNLIAFGLSGWMADFGEYLPADTILSSGENAEMTHNAWPVLWARCNYEAIKEAEQEGLVVPGEIVYFMRAGGAGSQRFCPLMWAGDQNVDWSEDDGLPSVITAALSLGLSGHGLHHADLGGYTTLYGMKRSKELFMRWAEVSAFSVLMRSHEGNRPNENWQFDSDQETLDHLASISRIHVAMKPYLKTLVEENATLGLPVMRPLFLHYGVDRYTWTCKDEYLLGHDLLVAPVIEQGKKRRRVHLPAGHWLHLWSGREFGVSDERCGMDTEIAAPVGQPPVFARFPSPWMPLFNTLCDAM